MFFQVFSYGFSGGNKVALIIGGYQTIPSSSSEAGITNSVELFGCPGSQDSVLVQDFHIGNYLTGATFLEGSEKVLVCGGFR